MYNQLFRNRWAALGFVVITAMGAASLVGSEEDEGLLGDAATTIADQREQFVDDTEALSDPDLELPRDDGSFASDGELYEEGEGLSADPILDDPVDPQPDMVVSNRAPEEAVSSAPEEFVIVDGEIRFVD